VVDNHPVGAAAENRSLKAPPKKSGVTHWSSQLRAWLERNPRTQLHFTSTSGSWLNMVEIFFEIITRQAIRRGTFDSVADLTHTIGTYIDGWNDRCHPFSWTTDADTILAKATHPKNRKTDDTSITRH